ncbi:MAG: methyltransferase domain-containing protein [Kiritimatiellia bacterium]
MKKSFAFLSLVFLFAGSASADEGAKNREVAIRSKVSMLHLGSIDSFDITERGKAAARELLEGIEQGDPAKIQSARKTYGEIIPLENFGGEYSALQWFCDVLLAPEAERPAFFTDPLTQDFHRFFGENDYAVLKEYLKRKYRLVDFKDSGTREGNTRLGYLDDFILFNNPRRETWEKTSRIMEALDVRPGQSIADIGSGPGYYTFKFSRLVGPEGQVFALDINDLHVAYLSNFVAKTQLGNVQTVLSDVENAIITNSVDMAFLCSLYHVIYTTSTEPAKDSLVESIKRMLKPDGRLAIVDNGLVDDATLPYHGPYISRDLLVAQIEHYGFALEKSLQIIPQRYLLLFRKADPPPAGPAISFADGRTDLARIGSRLSLVHLPNDDEPSITIGAREAAKVFHLALETKDRDALQLALEQFQTIIEKEKVGDEQSAFAWFCEYLLADEAGQKAMRDEGFNAEYLDFLDDDDFKMLKLYIQAHYGLGKEELAKIRKSGFDQIKKRFFPTDEAQGLASVKSAGEGQDERQAPPRAGGQKPPPDRENPDGEGPDRAKRQPPPPGAQEGDSKPERPPRDGQAQPELPGDLQAEQVVFLRDFVLFNNPNRAKWEKSGLMLEAVGLKPGDSVADIGCGPGYYSYMFSGKVGTNGQVYAVDTNRKHLEYIQGVVKNRGIGNIETLESRFDDCCLQEDSIDVAFLCSLYTVIYTASIEKVKDDFVASLHRALRKDGRLIIVDNAVVEGDVQPYHGPYMSKELIVAQMKYYGFDLVRTEQFIPQRYMLVFREADAPAPIEAQAPAETAP